VKGINLRAHLALMRPHQYVKNVLIFFPAFFAKKMGIGGELDIQLLLQSFGAFLAFCLFASTVYILNDYVDREDDRRHPKKKYRPLASGAVKPKAAFVQMALQLLIGGTLFIWAGGWPLLALGAAYLLMNTAYSFKLKHIPIIDLVIIAIGFVMRLFVGAMVGEIELSMWIILITFLLALFLGLAKRRDDVLLLAQGKKVRKSIDGYNLEFINGAMIMMASVTIVAYISYTISPESQGFFQSKNLYYTVFWVILGILRYLQITFVEEKSGSPTKVLLKDIFLQLTILGWLVTFGVLIYVV
jgi:4-hydroxybenzoate polyprenyltransferase